MKKRMKKIMMRVVINLDVIISNRVVEVEEVVDVDLAEEEVVASVEDEVMAIIVDLAVAEEDEVVVVDLENHLVETVMVAKKVVKTRVDSVEAEVVAVFAVVVVMVDSAVDVVMVVSVVDVETVDSVAVSVVVVAVVIAVETEEATEIHLAVATTVLTLDKIKKLNLMNKFLL